MIASTPTKDYLSFRTRNPSMSPSCRPRHCTPPRLVSASNDPPSYDSPMLTPSHMRQRPLFPNPFNPELADPDDLFLQSPYKSPAQAHHLHSHYSKKPQPIIADDDEGSIFLSSPSSSFSPFFPTSSSQPLRTPVKQIHRFPSRTALSVKHTNTGEMPLDAVTAATRVGVGTKRKSTPHSTPIRQHNLTPLMISSHRTNPSAPMDVPMLDRLAPLPAPKFTAATTPQSNAETDAHLRRQTATLTRLKLTDFIDAVEDVGGDNNHSGCEMDDEYSGSARLLAKAGFAGKRKEKEEVAEAISPGGHIVKRRARRRPLSSELLESARPALSPRKALASNTGAHRPRNTGIVFPSAPSRKRTSSGSSSSELGSPVPRRRVSNARPLPPKPPFVAQTSTRLPMSRQDSSATLFFGPAIPPATKSAPVARSRNNTSLSSSTSSAPLGVTKHPKVINRHSYAGSSLNSLQAWNTIQTRDPSQSPKSSPPAHAAHSNSQDDYDQEMFFGSGTANSSFMFSVTEGTPSPRANRTIPATLPRKYKPRDSGVVLSDDEDDNMSIGGDYLRAMPAASTSVGSVHSDADDNLVTPGFAPETGSGWPSVFVTGTDDVGSGEGLDVDAFIMRTLAAAASKGAQEAKKRVPGTPVKKAKTTYLPGGARPWQSAVASKVGLRYDVEPKKGKVPRQSLPAAFPPLGKKAGKLTLDQSTDSEDDDDSPGRRRDKYVGLGLGRPSASTPYDGNPLLSRTRLLLRRSSSGAFSSGSDSMSSSGTPTRMKGKDWSLLQTTPRIPSQLSPSKNAFKLPPVRSTSGSSTSSGATLNSPSIPSSRRFPTSSSHVPRPIPMAHRSSEPFAEEQPGRFERDFLEDDEVGSGEFGQVIKVRCKNGGDNSEVYAVKKSKRFEGPRHRLRLREEVQVLQHLSQVAASSSSYEGNRHPNVLTYIDSWEEHEALFIRTELCESGNLAQFLWEFGRVYPRLSEDRVWKIVVDLSNGLRFIHDAGVIHLDLKPANVFVTAEGRFKIGDFGMATLWPRPNQPETSSDGGGGFEREGDKLYLAPEVLQGRYSKAADVFSFGMTILETATNIVVPDQGEAWHRLRREDFAQIDLDESPELLDVIRQMMRTEPSMRMSIHAVCNHPIVSRARAFMERVYLEAKRDGTSVFAASPLSSVHPGFLEEILGRGTVENGAMDVSA